jgi:hypothetical protein
VCDGTATTLTTNNNSTYTYQWKKDNTVITTANANSYVATQAGTYNVIVSDTNGCSDSPATFTINPLPTVAITSTGNCLGDTLITNVPDSTIAQVTWYKDGQVVQTALPNFDPTGEIIAGNGIGGLNINWSSDIYVDDEGNQYFSDPDNHRVVKYNPITMTSQIVAGGNGGGNALNQLNYPMGIYVNDNFDLFIADRDNHRIVKWVENATTGVVVAGTSGVSGVSLDRLSSPSDVLVDNSGNIYVSDMYNHRVVKWGLNATAGVIVAGTNQAGSGLNQLHNPKGIVLKNNEVFVADYDNHRIMKFVPSRT